MKQHSNNPNPDNATTEELKEDCHSCCGGNHELDTSQGDFTTIAAGILLALAVYALIPRLAGIRLGDYPVVLVYGGFLALTVFFWFLAEKIKHHKKNDQ